MARRTNEAKLDSQTARRKLPPQHAVYWNLIAKGCALGYRRSKSTKAGVWSCKYTLPKDLSPNPLACVRIQTTIGDADDWRPADGTTCFSCEQARKKAIEWFGVAANKLTGTTPRQGRYTVAKACEEYARSLEGRSPSAYITKKVIAANIVPTLGTCPVERLTRARIEKLMLDLVATPRRKPRHGLDPDCEEAVRRRKDSANRYLTVLKAALNRALAEGRIACSGLAWKQVSPFKNVAQTRTRFLSDDEARKLAAVGTPAFKRLVQGDLYSGCRYSEVTRLRVFDFEAISASLLVAHSKSAKPRRIYLDPEAAAFFGYVCKGKRGDELIFQQEDGSPFEKGSIKGLMAEAAKAANIGSLTFHELRHTAASRWARLGLSLQEIAAQLGHADIRMTQRYAHLCKQILAEKVRSLPTMHIWQSPDPEIQLSLQ
jgi:integrase